MHSLGYTTTLVAAQLAALAMAQATITVNMASELQEMDGFGVSQAFGRASEFEDMDSGPRKDALDYLFSQTTGAGLSIIRNRIGSGGSGDSILPSSPGCTTCAPNYVWDNDDAGQVWFTKNAMEYGVEQVYVDAWSAPGFMKTNGDQSNGGYLCGVSGASCSSGDWRQAYADFLVQYVKYYIDNGMPVTHLGFLNEPDYVTSYSSMESSGNQAADFIPTLYDTLAAEGLEDQVKIACCDAIGWPGQKTMTSQLVSRGMEQYLGLITSHMYTGDPDSPMSTSLKTWQTEGCDLDNSWSTDWYSNGGLGDGLTWADKIAKGVIDAGLSGYIYWQGAEVNQFQANSYLVASDGSSVYPSGRLWAFAQWSRYVRPGARRVSVSGSLSSTRIGAFKNTDGSVAVVFTNTGSSSQSTKLVFENFTPTDAIAYLTDNSHSVSETSVSLSSGAVTVSIPTRSVVTVKLTSGDGTGGDTMTTTSTTSTSTTSAPATTTTTTANCSAQWDQCGGNGWMGVTCCASGTTCTYYNEWYSQCI
ncbi:Glucuronoxylanase XynC [Zalerion maritima]|uniref:Glucuronoxylanase XynC n=1 Tax=Zalerion maritima TaxID=339359 RepID=A0AAD5RRF6_9PEZI|nr:Glucuronoxylanase XynC [Zalerion maritima]